MDNRHSPERDCLYCLHHSDPKTRCVKCLTKVRPIADGSGTLCSTCKLLCRTSGCTNVLADDSPTRCSNCYKECNVIDCKKPWTGASYCKKHSNPFTRCRKCKTRGLADGSEIQLCSTCNLLCRTNNCKNQLADDHATLCSTCNLLCRTKNCNQAFVGGGDAKLCANYRHNLFGQSKRIIIPNKECNGCKKELADGDMQYYCSTCNFVFQNIYYYYYFYNLCTIIDRQLDNYI